MTEQKPMKSVHEVHAFMDEIDGSLVYRHERHGVGVCPWCDLLRVRNISDEFIRRIEACGVPIPSLNMWSLGSSLKDTGYNRKIMLKRWRLFQWRMRKYPDWLPLFRVIEAGRRGFLHFHVVAGHYIRHSIVLEEWRGITNEPSNVHVSGSNGHVSPTNLVRYLMKYLNKSATTYRWMGPLWGVGGTTRSGKGKGRGLRYMGVTCYSVDTRAYEEKDPQQSI